MAVSLRLSSHNKRGVLCHLKTIINSSAQMQSLHSDAPPKGVQQDGLSAETASPTAVRGCIDVSKWKTLDARELGISRFKISHPSWIVLDCLHHKGFKAYLVGGCVRDLLLNRTPKDFDVITTADLNQVRKHLCKLGRAPVVGKRFPLCMVHVKGSVVEVTSFQTVAQTSKGKDQLRYTLLPKCGNKEHLVRCKNSLHRDFTINSLFYDPFANKIYDYTNGLADLRSLKLECVIPAQLSLKEDPGRILRGFRIAARLGLSLSRDTESAILTHSSLVKSLDKSRLMIELNYMMSYGAAEPSLRLLWKFNLLEFLLPVHAAYLDRQANKEDAQAPNMLMKLFLHLDSLVACDRPSDCTLWIGLLTFHLALVNNPQDALVVWALASVLYHGEWEEGIKFARGRAELCINFSPEIRRSHLYKSDEEIAQEITKLASLAMDSTSVLVDYNSLLQYMSARYPSFHSSGIVWVTRKTGKLVSHIFEVLVNDVQSYRRKRPSSKINYDMLGKGDLSETRYVLGKIVLDTMSSGIVGDRGNFEAESCHLKTEGTKEISQLQLSDPPNHHSVARKDKRRGLSMQNPEPRQRKIKKLKLVENGQVTEKKADTGNHRSFEKFEYKEISEEQQKRVNLGHKADQSMREYSEQKKKKIQKKQPINDRSKTTTVSESSSVSKDRKEVANNSDTNASAKTINKSDLKNKKPHLSNEVVMEKQRQKPHKSEQNHRSLSSLFK